MILILEKTKKIKVVSKYGKFIDRITLQKALFSVKRDKSKWIDSETIQVLYHHKDEQALKREVWIRDNYTCQYCGDIMHEGHPELTVDHLTPKRLGGSILPKNMACSCRECNGQKGFRTYDQYFLHLYAGLLFMVLWGRLKNINTGGVEDDRGSKEVKD